MPLSYADLKNECRLTYCGDKWGDIMNWWFTIAEEIYHNRPNLSVPTEWQFKPSPLGNCNEPDNYTTTIIEAATDNALMKFGALIHRYAEMLKTAGQSY